MTERTARTSRTQSLSSTELPLEAVRIEAVDGPGKGAKTTLEEGTLVVGSSASRAGLTLADKAVSGQHASVEVMRGAVRVRDLGSRNGTFFLGARIESANVPLGSAVTLGRTTLRFSPLLEAHESDKTELAGLVASSQAMRRLLWRVERVAPGDATVVLRGPTGAGKEAVARALHALSPRAKGPFQVFDCAGARGELLESELFGHVKGAFTGASADRAGLVELANHGTLVLDNVDQLPIELQPRLLRFLENRTVRRVGGNKDKAVDVRVLATTQTALDDAVQAGRLRADIFFRLSAVVLDVPALSQRREDIPLLAARFAKELGMEVELSKSTVAALQAHPWPGNARELRNAVSRCLAFGQLDAPAEETATSEPVDERGLKQARAKVVSAFEADFLRALLRKHDWNVSAVAREAKMARSHLYTLIQRYKLERDTR